MDKENEPPHERRPRLRQFADNNVDGDGLFVRTDKGSMSLREYTCLRGRIKFAAHHLCDVLHGRHANQTWTREYHTPKEFNLKDAFRLIQAKTQSNTTVWGRLGLAKQRDIVKYVSCAEPASLVRSVRLLGHSLVTLVQIHCSTTVRPVGWRES
ncbi:BZ3500_MvSof-1268-A1-R1_Chr7-1g09274 [Microbotryum saponariae]|nr:BZ3501_MvSof-1269-A2-R1_Chr7-1g08979 [Microbotryum saponariae]SDA03137.1 BZ3500_MvSof-1268-A1-R1_Chr7-1g09274 [Microbotryum saponariae]